MAESRTEEAQALRTKHEAKIAGFTDERHVVLSRGASEGVQVGTFYAVLGHDLKAVALVRVVDVEDKLARAEGAWHDGSGHALRIGQRAVLWGRVTREESEIREGLKVVKMSLVNVTKSLKEAGDALPFNDVMQKIQMVEQYRSLKWMLREEVDEKELEG